MSAAGRDLALDLAQEGMVLARALTDAAGAVLLAQGATLTAANLAALRRRGVESCCIIGSEEAAADPAAQAQAARTRARQLERLQLLFRATSPDSAGAELLALLQRYRQEGQP
ncbi:hypothetical protein [Janthinobacterium sp.]|uniref:hypothetical protein n=1 Tax=Janthinobacterium sp. TaxID=1871054 RepID=UPI00260A1220|nr:hypothetical protein [Janthinobacterium sp.]